MSGHAATPSYSVSDLNAITLQLLSLAQIGRDVVWLNCPKTQAFGRRSGDYSFVRRSRSYFRSWVRSHNTSAMSSAPNS